MSRFVAYIAQLVLWDMLDYFDERFFDRASKKYPELDGALDEKLNDTDQDIVYLAQWGLYAMVPTNLWVLTILPLLPRETILVALLSFGLFFIIDDWTITTEYARSLKGRIFPWHDFRVHVFNVLLIGPLLILLFLEFSWTGAIISGIVLGIFLFWRYAWIRTGW